MNKDCGRGIDIEELEEAMQASREYRKKQYDELKNQTNKKALVERDIEQAEGT